MNRTINSLFICWACWGVLLGAASPALGCDKDGGTDSELFEFAGTVTAEGRPLAGVEVRCVFARRYYATANFGPVEMTDQDGRFQIKSRVKRFKLVAVHPDYHREVSDWLTREDVSIDLI